MELGDPRRIRLVKKEPPFNRMFEHHRVMLHPFLSPMTRDRDRKINPPGTPELAGRCVRNKPVLTFGVRIVVLILIFILGSCFPANDWDLERDYWLTTGQSTTNSGASQRGGEINSPLRAGDACR